jgi:hypothetical protein
VSQRLTVSSPTCKVGLGTIAAALTAFTMAVAGHLLF